MGSFLRSVFYVMSMMRFGIRCVIDRLYKIMFENCGYFFLNEDENNGELC